ncbi:hypothetical protein BSKO_10584 [Bryopsis sp. KO-2023]|nr:hypothetical protein BSKO_10584 [Bryopsis sp. KO-2023]
MTGVGWVTTMCRAYCVYQIVASASCVGFDTRRRAGRDVLTVLSKGKLNDYEREQEMESALVRLHSPDAPLAWAELATNARHRGATAIRESLAKPVIEVPDVEDAAAHKCSLALRPEAQRFRDDSINRFIAELFSAITNATELPCPKVHLDRFDLFHAHLFLDYATSDMGLIFHAREYPAFDKVSFPYILGYCQQDSTMPYAPLEMDFRNFVWFKGELAALDTGEDTVLGKEILYPGTELFRTVFEDELGDAIADLFYFDSLECPCDEKIFVCWKYFGKPLPRMIE